MSMCTEKLEEVLAKLSRSSRDFIFLNAFLSAGGILYRHLCPATEILARPSQYLSGHLVSLSPCPRPRYTTFWVDGVNAAPVNRLEHSHFAHEVSVNRPEQPAEMTGTRQQ